VARVKVDIDPTVDMDKDVVIAVDSTGIKVSNRGEWIREKWYNTKRKGFIKFHIAVDTKTSKILSIDVTKENITDGARAIPLIKSASKRVGNISRSLMDEAYDRRSIFNYLSKEEEYRTCH
jgi:hypothetical protein